VCHQDYGFSDEPAVPKWVSNRIQYFLHLAFSTFDADALSKCRPVDVINSNRDVLLPSKGQKCINQVPLFNCEERDPSRRADNDSRAALSVNHAGCAKKHGRNGKRPHTILDTRLEVAVPDVFPYVGLRTDRYTQSISGTPVLPTIKSFLSGKIPKILFPATLTVQQLTEALRMRCNNHFGQASHSLCVIRQLASTLWLELSGDSWVGFLRQNARLFALEQRQACGKRALFRSLIAVEVGVAVNLRRRICYLLSLLRIHRPNCKHCAACLTCGTELRERLQELNGPTRLGSPMPESIMG
jgi:hypothetical protein